MVVLTAAWRRPWLWLLLVLLISTAAFLHLLFRPVQPLDEGITLVYPELIRRGLLPNRDFCSLYPPGGYWLLTGAFALFGPSLVTERLVGLAYLLVTTGSAFLLALEGGIGAAVLLSLLVAMAMHFFTGGIAAYAWFGAAAWLMAAFVVFDRAGRAEGARAGRLTFLAGAMQGAAILFRHDLAPLALASGLAIVGLRPAVLIRYLAGMALGVLPLAVHGMIVGPTAFFDNLLWDVLRGGATRRLPPPWHSKFLWLVLASCVTPSIALAAAWLSKGRPPEPLCRGLALFCLLIIPQFLQRADGWHLAYVGCLTLPLCGIVLLRLSRTWIATPPLPTWVGAIALLLVAASSVPSIRREALPNIADLRGPCAGCVTANGRTLLVAPEVRAPLQRIVDRLNAVARPGARLFVGPADLSRTNYNDSYLYFLFPQLTVGSFYIEMASAVTDRPGSRLASDLARADFALLNDSYDDWNEPNASAKHGSYAPVAVLQRRFCPIAAEGPYKLFVRCDAKLGDRP